MTWIADHWSQLAALALAAAVLLVLCWALRGDDYRTRNDRTAAQRAVCGPRPEPGEPGSDEALLDACNQLCPDLARKEMP
jgi:hypothetical protein